MNSSVHLVSAADLTPALVTSLLQAAGAGRVVVREVDVLERKAAGAMGAVHPLVVRYAEGGSAGLPERFVFKRTRQDVEFSPVEVRFYQELAPELPAGIAPRCYAASYCAQTRQYQLLLEDLSETHECRLAPGLPAIGPDHVGQLFECLAALHAARWERPLAGFGRRAADPLQVTRSVFPALSKAYPDARERLGDALGPGQDELYGRYFAARFPALCKRLESRSGFALLHGDAHVGNVLFPRDPSAGRAVLIDWSVVRTGPAVWDLSFPLMWTDPRCRARAVTQALLERYHAELCARGVVNYDLAQCEDDFRHALLDNLRAPIGQLSTKEIPAYVPIGAHAAAMELIEAWECADLLPR